MGTQIPQPLGHPCYVKTRTVKSLIHKYRSIWVIHATLKLARWNLTRVLRETELHTQFILRPPQLRRSLPTPNNWLWVVKQQQGLCNFSFFNEELPLSPTPLRVCTCSRTSACQDTGRIARANAFEAPLWVRYWAININFGSSETSCDDSCDNKKKKVEVQNSANNYMAF